MDFDLFLLDVFNSNCWLYFILILYVYNSKFHILYAVSFIYRIWVLIVFLSHPFKECLFLSKKNGLIALSPLSRIVFPVVFIDLLISYECDHLFGFLLLLAIISRAFVFLPYIIRGTWCNPPFSMWWWKMSGRGSGFSATSAAWSGHFDAKWEGRGRCRGGNSRGQGWQRTTRRPPQTRRPALTPEPWPQRQY